METLYRQAALDLSRVLHETHPELGARMLQKDEVAVGFTVTNTSVDCRPGDMLINHTTIPFDPTQLDKAMALVTALVEHSKTESGTVHYRAMTDIEDSTVVQFFEVYEDASAAEKHADSEQYRQFVESLPNLVDGKIETIQVQSDSIERAEFTAGDAVNALD